MKIKNGEFIIGDCLEKMKDIPDNSIDLVLTDIPYGEVNRKSNGLRNLDKSTADIVLFNIESLIKELSRVAKGSVYIFCGTKQISGILTQLETEGMSTRIAFWEKPNPSPMNGQNIWLSAVEVCAFGKKKGATFNEHCKPAVWKQTSVRGKIHPTQKPVSLFERLILASSNEGDTILDCFAGSGTTAIASENTNRKWICIEQNEVYAKLAIDRIENLT